MIVSSAINKITHRQTICWLLTLLSVCPAGAESLVTAVSSNLVSIRSNFTGAQIVLFGSIERDARTVGRRAGYDVIIVVRGPDQEIVTRRKERTLGIWTNRHAVRYINAPSYLGIFSNRPIEDIAAETSLKRYQLGLHNQILLSPASPVQQADNPAGFEKGLLRLMQQRDLYLEQPYGVQFLSPSLFLSRVPLPANVPTGIYTAHVYLFGDGALLEQSQIEISIRKGGLEQTLSKASQEQPLIYGLLCVLAALVMGWIGAVVFRRD